MKARVARMAHHRDLAGESDWIAVDCDGRGAPVPVCVKHEWPATHAVGAAVADAAQWMLTARRLDIAAASGLGPVDTIFNVLRNLPTSKLPTEDLEAARDGPASFEDNPHLWPTLAPVLGQQHRAPR